MEIAWPQLRDFFRAKLVEAERASAAQDARALEQQRSESIKAAQDEQLAALARTAHGAFMNEFQTEAEQRAMLEQFKPSWVTNALSDPGRALAIDAWYRKTRGAS